MKWILIAFCLLAWACSPTPQSAPPEQASKQIEPEGYISLRDGNKLFYQMQGKGKQTLLFLHGWCIDGSYFQQQMDYLQHDFQVISIDLLGHGKSDRKRQNWRMEAFGADIVEVVQQLELKHVVLVAHSMSEMIAVEAAQQLGGVVEAIVGVDTYINPLEQVAPEDSVGMMNAFRNNFGGMIVDWMGSYFPEETDSATKEFIINDMMEGPEDVCVAIMEELIRYQNSGRFPKLITELQVPLRTINVIPPQTEAWDQIEADFDWEMLENAGHYPMLEVADAFNEKLASVLADLRN